MLFPNAFSEKNYRVYPVLIFFLLTLSVAPKAYAVPNDLTGSFTLNPTTVLALDTLSPVGNISFTLPPGELADSQCSATAELRAVGGSARPGIDFNLPATTLVFGNGDGNSKSAVVSLEVFSGRIGTDDKTVELVATFTSNGVDGVNSCPLVSMTPQRKTITLNSLAAKSLAGSVRQTVTQVQAGSGEIEIGSLVFELGAGLEADSNCKATAEMVLAGGTAQIGTDFNFAPVSLVFGIGDPSPKAQPIRLTVLPNTTDEGNKTVELKTTFTSIGGPAGNTCPFDTRVDTRTVTITNEVVTVPEPEPETVLTNSCDVLVQNAAILSGSDKAFLESNCRGLADPVQNALISRNFEPEEVAAQSDAVLTSAGTQRKNINSRLSKLRTTQGKRGVDVSSINLNVQGQHIPGRALTLGGAAGDGENELLEGSRWGVFANGEYGFGGSKRSDADLEVGSGDRLFDFNSKGVTLGADYRFPGERYIAGLALGYKDFTSDFTTQEGDTGNKGYNFSFYSTYLTSDKSYIDALISVGRSQIDASRPVNNDGSQGVGLTTTFAIAQPDAEEVALSLGGGYEFSQGEWVVTPYGRVDYTKGIVEAYTETPSHPSAVTSMFRINQQNIESLSTSLGVRANRTISTSEGVFVPQASLEWKHEFKDRSVISGTSTYLSGDGASFGLNGNFLEDNADALDRDYFNVGVGVSAVFPKGRSGYLNLESRFGDDQVTDNAVKLGFRWEF